MGTILAEWGGRESDCVQACRVRGEWLGGLSAGWVSSFVGGGVDGRFRHRDFPS